MMQPAGLAAMSRLGLRDAIERLGHRITKLHGVTDKGRTIFDLSYGPDLYALAVHRAALHGVLWDEFARSGVRLLTGQEVRSVASPLLASADFIVDASGARSVLREFVSTKKPRPFVYGAVWASVPDIGIAPGTLAQRYVGAKVMLGYLPVGRQPSGDQPLAALFWSLRDGHYDPWRARFDAWREEARLLWPDLGPVLDGLTGPDDFTHATYVHYTAKQPWRGNVVQIGDAAHVTSPQLGQGANQALIDAVVLTDAIATSTNLPEAFSRYADARRAHVRFYQYASWMMTPFFQSDSRTLAWLRDLVFHPMKRMPWLHREMVRTLAGLKTGPFGAMDAAAIVNRLAKP
jgi:2-polyprenyl-6-methoxyphenol hydroxylase-like FAD-dependent oxidoreductase